jgi:hypothetical protein
MTTFEEQGFYIERSAISQESAKMLANDFNIVRDYVYFVDKTDPNDLFRYKDKQSTRSFSWYSPTCFESLLLTMLPKVESITNKKLYPSYSYGRIYYNGAELPKHKDRRSCEYSVTMTIEMDATPWDILFNKRSNEIEAVSLNVGDMCVYRGYELEHWREPYQGTRQIQAFLHYVDSTGEFVHYKNDTRPLLGLPTSYRNHNYDLLD